MSEGGDPNEGERLTENGLDAIGGLDEMNDAENAASTAARSGASAGEAIEELTAKQTTLVQTVLYDKFSEADVNDMMKDLKDPNSDLSKDLQKADPSTPRGKAIKEIINNVVAKGLDVLKDVGKGNVDEGKANIEKTWKQKLWDSISLKSLLMLGFLGVGIFAYVKYIEQKTGCYYYKTEDPSVLLGGPNGCDESSCNCNKITTCGQPACAFDQVYIWHTGSLFDFISDLVTCVGNIIKTAADAVTPSLKNLIIYGGIALAAILGVFIVIKMIEHAFSDKEESDGSKSSYSSDSGGWFGSGNGSGKGSGKENTSTYSSQYNQEGYNSARNSGSDFGGYSRYGPSAYTGEEGFTGRSVAFKMAMRGSRRK
jgi:hypothetical protein